MTHADAVRDLSVHYEGYAVRVQKNNKLEDACGYFQHVLKLGQQLFERAPTSERAQLDFALSFGNVAETAKQLRKWDEADAAAKEEREILEPLAQAYPYDPRAWTRLTMDVPG